MTLTQWFGGAIIAAFLIGLTALTAWRFESWKAALVIVGAALGLTALLTFAAFLLAGGLT